jgi:hypothetical protein
VSDERVVTALTEWADRASERIPETRAADVWARPAGHRGTDMEVPGRTSRLLLIVVTALAILASTAVVVVDVLDNDTTDPSAISSAPVAPEVVSQIPAGVAAEITRFNAVSATPALLPADVPAGLTAQRAVASPGDGGSPASVDIWFADPSLTKSVRLRQSDATTRQLQGNDPSQGGSRGQWSFGRLDSGGSLDAATRFDDHTVVEVTGNVSRAELERFVASVSKTYRNLPD